MNDTPNQKWPNEPFRAVKKDGEHRTGVSVTPVWGEPANIGPDGPGRPVLPPGYAYAGQPDDDHWLDRADRRIEAVKAKLAVRGFDFSDWKTIGDSFELRFTEAMLAVIEGLEARIARNEADAPPKAETAD